MKEVATLVVIGCTGIGCCIGGVLNSVDSFRYETALSSPSFFHLVDEGGYPVSKDLK